ncbi:MAG TPA: 50S ribosomal protein L13, partial [Candidatus Saccharimonadales bacterium]|nr:50S ribosomal protein L13 [Candidatus Saccharimonadales bacterium]
VVKTFSQKPAEVVREWYVIDASQASFGRIATKAASLLIGKGKPGFTPHVDGGDFVIIINADKMIVTGGKQEKKRYYYHSGYPGGLREKTMSQVGSVGVIEEAVRGMLPVNKLRRGRLARLKVYAGSEHGHSAQKPITLSMKGGN